MKKIKWSGDKLVGISALVISLATLFTLIYQSRIMREHEMKSSFPKLELWHSNSADHFKLLLMNTGLGPAVIEDYHITYRGQVYEMDHVDFAHSYSDSLKSDSVKISFSTSSLRKGRIIQPGDELYLISLRLDSTSSHPLKPVFKNREAELTIKYSSVYHQLWEINGVADIPKLRSEKAEVINGMMED